jgi:hypothetical protein
MWIVKSDRDNDDRDPVVVGWHRSESAAEVQVNQELRLGADLAYAEWEFGFRPPTASS